MSQELEAIKALGDIVAQTNAKSGADLEKLQGEAKERFERIDADLQKSEAKNQELTAQISAEIKSREELKDRMNELELKAARAPRGEQKQVSAELKAFATFMQKGLDFVGEDRKALNTAVETEGGVLVPVDFAEQLIKDITEVSPIRQIAMVRQTTGEQYAQPRRTANLSALWTGELQDRGTTQQIYGSETVNLNSLTAIVPISNRLLGSTAFNMEQEINGDAAEQFAAAEGAAYVNGNGVEKPFGFLNESGIGGITSGTNDTVTGDDLINLAGELKTGYDPVYVINRRELAFLKTLKGSNGQYLWGNGLAAGLPNTINGYRYVEANDMPDIADGTKPVAFGDFMKGYLIVDKMGIVAIRDPYTRKNEGIVEFSFEKRTGGKVVLKEAIKILTVQ